MNTPARLVSYRDHKDATFGWHGRAPALRSLAVFPPRNNRHLFVSRMQKLNKPNNPQHKSNMCTIILAVV